MRLRVLAVASECFPLIKTGGLADVMGALPGALAGAGIAVTTLLPGYPAGLAAIGDAPGALGLPRRLGSARPRPAGGGGVGLPGARPAPAFEPAGQPLLGP